MIQTLQEVLERALERLSTQIVTYIPPLLVGLAILAVTFLVARLVKTLFAKVFKGTGVDRFIRESGVASFLPGSGFKIVPMLAEALYWVVMVLGILTALNVFDTKLTSQIVEGTILLFPKLVAAASILLAGFWLAQFLGRSLLIWASNEEFPSPRRLASVLRVAVVFISVVVAADILNFAARVFFAAFIITAGGAVLAVSLAFGFGARHAVARWLREKDGTSDAEAKTFFHHV